MARKQEKSEDDETTVSTFVDKGYIGVGWEDFERGEIITESGDILH